jgi:hypothetical protein
VQSYLNRQVMQTLDSLGLPIDDTARLVDVTHDSRGNAIAYLANVDRQLPGSRRVLIEFDLLAGARAGKIRIELLSRFGPREWAWHYDSFHLADMGSWGHEHRSAGEGGRVRSSAQDIEAGLRLLLDEAGKVG